jgi:type I protein arginine methyltransferase
LTDPDTRGTVELVAERDATVHGLSAWFDAEIAEGIGFSNAPGETEAIYGQAYFPFPIAVQIQAGDRARVSIHARLVRDDYAWRWSTALFREGGGQPVHRFDQSTLLAAPLDPLTLAPGERTFVPTLGRDGELDRFILERMDAQRSVGEIAAEAGSAFGDLLPTPERALGYTGELSRRYGR